MRSFARVRAGRGLAGGTAAVVAAPLLFLAATGQGLPVSQVQMSGGGAWLASPAQGVVTLIDGPSEQVVGLVRAPGAAAGEDVSVVQAGPSAYLVNTTDGTLARVDGGTYEVSDAVRFGTPRGGLEVLAGGSGLYVVDGSRRLASVTDPVTLRERQRLSLAARPGPGQSVVDAAGRLWVVDATGLAWYDGAGKRTRPGSGGADARLVLVQGRAVLVDLAGRRLGRLTGDGEVESWYCLDAQAGDGVQLLGSTSAGQVYAALAATGTLLVSAVDTDDCGTTLGVGKPGDEFGPLVQSGTFVFVPNRTSGRTAVVDLGSREVVADLPVVDPGRRLELVAKDGLVFYNDLDGDRAGVIRFDGQRWEAGAAVRKYDRSNIGQALLVPAGADERGRDGAGEPGDQRPGRTEPERDDDGPGPGRGAEPAAGDDTRPPPGQPQPPGAADPGGAADPAAAGDPGPPDPPAGPTPPAGPVPPVVEAISVNPAAVVREQPATFSALVRNADGATWEWTVTDLAGNPPVHTASDPGGFTHTFPAGTPDTMVVRLVVRTEAGTGELSQQFSTTSSLAPQITGIVADVPEPGLDQLVTFTADEPVAGPRGTWTWAISDSGGGQVVPPTAAPAQTGFQHAFPAAGRYRVTLTVGYDGAVNEAVHDITVSDQCQVQRRTASPLDLAAQDQVSFQVSTVGCFSRSAATPLLSVPGWFVPSGGPNGDQNDATGQATWTMSLSRGGTPPTDGLDQGALTVRLGNGSQVSYDVLGNRAPFWNDYAVCLNAFNGQTQFLADFEDANLATLQVVLTVGGVNRTMERVDGGSAGHGTFWSLFVPTADLPGGADTWTVRATDEFGLPSDLGTGQRGTSTSACW